MFSCFRLVICQKLLYIASRITDAIYESGVYIENTKLQYSIRLYNDFRQLVPNTFETTGSTE